MAGEGFNGMHEVIERFRKEPVHFVRKVFKAEPTPEQAGILTDLADPHARITVRSGCGVGKTTVDAWALLWHTALFPNCKAAVTAPTKHQLEDALVAECNLWIGRSHEWFKKQYICTSKHLCIKGAEDTQFATFKTSSKQNPEALQGLHGDHVLVVVDEASGVEDATFQPLKGATGRFSTRVLLTANPTRSTGYFYNTHNKLAELWKRHVLSCIGNKNVPLEYIQEVAAEFGEDSDMYRVRVLGQFPRASVTQLIPRDVAEGAMQRVMLDKMFRHAPVVIGVDVAWEGDDRSAIFIRQGLATLEYKVFNQIDTFTLGGIVADKERQYDADAVFVDAGGVGVGTIDYLRNIGRSPIPVYFGGSAIQADMYKYKRSEMWFGIRQWLIDGGAIPPGSDDLIEDLVAPQFSYTTAGQRQLESKKSLKKRGFRSPDVADAMALTFAAPVRKKNTDPRRDDVRRATAKMDYQVL